MTFDFMLFTLMIHFGQSNNSSICLIHSVVILLLQTCSLIFISFIFHLHLSSLIFHLSSFIFHLHLSSLIFHLSSFIFHLSSSSFIFNLSSSSLFILPSYIFHFHFPSDSFTLYNHENSLTSLRCTFHFYNYSSFATTSIYASIVWASLYTHEPSSLYVLALEHISRNSSINRANVSNRS